MVTQGGEQTILALKKIGAVILLFAGLGLIAVGFNGGYTGWIVIGLVAIAAAILLFVAKIFRRNPS